MEKILIFGVSGFVGRYLAQEFIDNGYFVYGSDIARAENLIDTVVFYKVDLLDTIAVEKLVLEICPDLIINLAAISSVGASWNIPQTTISVNVIGALNIVEAARKLKYKPKVMFIGSSEEYETSSKKINEEYPRNANNPYGISKMAQEKISNLYRDRYDMKIYYVRSFNHTGVGQSDMFVLPSFCKQIAAIERSGNAGVITVGNIDICRDFSDVKDIVRAYRMVIESDDCNKVFNVGSGNAYSLYDLLNYIITLSSQKIDIIVDPAKIRPVDNPIVCCDCSYIKRELGWETRISIFDTLKEMYLYYL